MTLFTVGPVAMTPQIREAGAIDLPYFRTASFSDLMLGIERDLLALFGAPADSRAVLLSGSGSAGMEAAVASLFQPGDEPLLIVVGGGFGRRFAEIAERHGLAHDCLELPLEEDLTEASFAPFEGRRYAGVLINHGETSIGKLYDLDLVQRFCQRTGALLVVDAVSSFLNDPLDMATQGVDLALTASQKALALAPGLAPLVMGPRAVERILSRTSPLYYLDVASALRNQERGQTPWTPALAVIYQLRARLDEILAHGIEAEWAQRRRLAGYFREQLARRLPALTVPSFAKSMGLTPVMTAPYNARTLFERLEAQGLVITPSGGELATRFTRVGHMGALDESDYDRLLTAMAGLMAEEVL